MTAFHYTGRDDAGRFVSGTLEAPSRLEALAALQVRAVALTSVQSADSALGRVESALGVLSSDTNARLAAFRSLAALVGAGIPLQRSLEIVTQECSSGRFREAIAGISTEIEQGSSLEAALKRRPREFSPEVRAMIRAGEIAGSLDDALGRVARYLERSHALRKRVTGALVYPVVVAAMALCLTIFLLGSVVPAFSNMFAGMNVQLPPITRIVLAIGTLIDGPFVWLTLLVFVGAVAVGVKAAMQNRAFALAIDRLRLRIPVFGTLLRRGEVAACARTLGSLANAGVAIETALEAARTGARSASIAQALNAVLDAVRLGDGVAGAFSKTRAFGAMFSALARAGEESGTMGDMLLRVAEHEEIEIEASIATLGGVMEPLLIVTLGGMVGTIVAAVLIPLYSMIGSIK